LFSFGAVLYEMATGRPAFSGNTLAVIFHAILAQTPAPLSEVNPELPLKLEEIVNKALEKDRDLRYQSASDLRTDLRRLERDTKSARAATATTPALAVQRPKRVVHIAAATVLAVLAIILVAYKLFFASATPPRTHAERTNTAALPQAVDIATKPPGALAAIDGRPSASCRTPCTLTVAPGRHYVELTLPGYLMEHRMINVTDGPQHLAPIALRPPMVTLLLSSEPQGATISVDGKVQDKTTPVQLNLPRGTYTVVMTKDGKSKTRIVQLLDGNPKGLKIDFRTQ
jgi:hypothetical protein